MTPFRIIPWTADFLQTMRTLADELTAGRPGRSVIVFPHSRPRRYLTDLYRRECHAPMLLPRMITGQELRDLCRATWDQGSAMKTARRADQLDQIALLKRSVETVAQSLPAASPLKKLGGPNALDGMARFFPWGSRLADLLEECLNQMVDARDLLHAEGEVAPFAAALLGELRAIRNDYINALTIAGLSTPGLDAHLVARRAQLDPPLPAFMRGKSIILAGFVSLTRAEDALFHYLWKQGATVCLHTDPAVATGGGHWSCIDHARWIKNWRAECVLTESNRTGQLSESGPLPKVEPRLHFFAGYDLHSQLQELRQVLTRQAPQNGEARGQEPGSQAVVLPHASLLMPTLHHLPRKDINISLGYPLERSLLARLIDTILRAREGLRSTPEGSRHHWRPLLDLFRHPYVRMLRTLPQGEDGESSAPMAPGQSLRPLLRHLEQKLRSGNRLVRLPELLDELLAEILGNLDETNAAHDINGAPLLFGENDLTEENGELLEQTAKILVTAWNNIGTLREVADRLAAVCDLLLRHGRHIWPRFPIDAECLYRLMLKVIPSLADNTMADDPLPPETLFAIVRQAMADERVPFEADPLTGLQVLGALETRLLRFDSVYFLDLTEDRLPGAPRHDPLLPDNLRSLLGLPDTGRRDVLAAHTFYRLLAGAKDVWLFWQEGVEKTGLQDAKKIRSRFVEKALWDVEQARGSRLRPGDAPLFTATFPLSAPPVRDKTAIPKTPIIRARLESLLGEPLAPTRLDAYLRCPARFFREYVCHIRPLEEVMEGDDPMRVGVLLHKVLQRAYEPYVGKIVRRAELQDELVGRMLTLFREELDASDLRERLPAESWLMLEAAGPLRLHRFLDAQPDELILLQVERELTAVLDVHGCQRVLRGILDRVDKRGEQEIILDYKSGKHPRAPAATFWQRDDLWDAMTNWTPNARDPLPDVADALPSIQLPCYLYIYGKATGRRPADAAWVQLASDGHETPLLGPAWNEEDRITILDRRIPSLLHFVLDHIQNANAFTPRPGPQCGWCPYTGACR